MIDELGGVETCNHYPWGWANAGQHAVPPLEAGDLPGRHHRPVHRVLAGADHGRGELRAQYGHVIDLVPTVLEALGVEPPEAIRGVTQAPIEGISFAHTFDDADAPSQPPHPVLRDVRATARSTTTAGARSARGPARASPRPPRRAATSARPITDEVLAGHRGHDWELYNLDEDSAETRNLAAEHRDKLIEMIGRWWAEAGKYQVLPIDGTALERLNVERPTIARPRNTLRLLPRRVRCRSPPRPRATTGPGASPPRS